MKPLVSVVIVSYNTYKLTRKCIDHVYASTGLSNGEIEIILVDNNSSDKTVEYFKKNLAQVSLIANKANIGFGAGNNQGIKVARGEYILLLNTDAFVDHDTISLLLEELKNNQDSLAVGPKYRYSDGAFQQSFGYFPTLPRLMGWMWWLDKLPLIKLLFRQPYHAYDSRLYVRSRAVDWLMGACILIRKDDIESAGGFDEKIFMYAEEIELFLRLKEHTNKSCYYLSNAGITHLGSASSKQAIAARLVYELRGIEYIYRLHYPSLLLAARFILYTGVIMRILIFSLIPSRRDAVLEYKKFLSHTS